MLMGAHDGAVDHRIFVVGVCGEMPKHPLPHTAFGPAAEPQVDLYPITEPRRQIAPRHSGTITVQHRLYEQPIVRRGPQSESPHHRSVSNKLTAYESKKQPRRYRSRIIRSRLMAKCGNRDSPPHTVFRWRPSTETG